MGAVAMGVACALQLSCERGAPPPTSAPSIPASVQPEQAVEGTPEPRRSIVGRTGVWRLYVRFVPDPIPVNALFELEVEIEPLAANHGAALALAGVDASMPTHRHGMTLSPRWAAVGNGRYRVEGMLFHMPGRWEIRFDVLSGAETERVRLDVIVE